MDITGKIIGYDPGGNSKHGVAEFIYKKGNLVSFKVATCETANDVLDFIGNLDNLIAVGVDTLTCWSTGPSGWRPADRLLKKNYTVISNSIASANSLYGSMGLNGMSVLLSLKDTKTNLHISETHPKVLYYALENKKYNYSLNHKEMDELLSKRLNTEINTKNDHEWDAVVSVYAVLQGLRGQWETDLHALQKEKNERVISPCGKTHYWWPELMTL